MPYCRRTGLLIHEIISDYRQILTRSLLLNWAGAIIWDELKHELGPTGGNRPVDI